MLMKSSPPKYKNASPSWLGSMENYVGHITMPRIADCIYYHPIKVIHPFYVMIGGKKTDPLYYRGVFATFEEAVKSRDEYLKQHQ